MSVLQYRHLLFPPPSSKHMLPSNHFIPSLNLVCGSVLLEVIFYCCILTLQSSLRNCSVHLRAYLIHSTATQIASEYSLNEESRCEVSDHKQCGLMKPTDALPASIKYLYPPGRPQSAQHRIRLPLRFVHSPHRLDLRDLIALAQLSNALELQIK